MQSLENRILQFIQAGENDPNTFDQLAQELIQFQKLKIALFKISPLPTSAFKLGRVASFPSQETIATFFTSGTTEEEKGKHEFRSLELLEASYLQSFKQLVGRSSTYFLSLIPSRLEAPHSSLAHMV